MTEKSTGDHSGRFADQIAVVTGGASGIGLAAAKAFAREGASLVIADRNGEAARHAANSLDGAIAVAVDVACSDQVKAMASRALEHFGKIDILVNNAGFGLAGTVEETDEADWDALMAANVKGVYLCSGAVIPAMAAQGKGAIINIGSYTAFVGIPSRAAYVASKGAVVALTRAMALDHIGQGIRVNCVAPGTIASPYFDRMLAQSDQPEDMLRTLNERAPVGRMGRPEEIAEAILFLASDNSSFAVGSVLTIDGGTSIW